jgi:signal transduction histidine kinase
MLERHGIDVSLVIEGDTEPADERARTLVFTAVRELLFNVVKHAGVTEAAVELRRDRRHVRASVADRGAGFDPAEVEAGHGGFGLFGVRERVRALGGEVTLEARPGHGARVELRLPADVSGRRRPARPASASSAAAPARARDRTPPSPTGTPG